MHDSPPASSSLLAGGAGVLLGSGLQLQQPALWPLAAYAGVLACGAAALALRAAWKRHAARATRPQPFGPAARLAVLLAATAALAFGLTGLRAGWRLADALAPALEGRDLDVVAVVASLPQRAPQGWRFQAEVVSARLAGQAVALPHRLALGWHAEAEAAPPLLRPGQRWAFTLRLKRPHGAANPHGYDFELWLFERGLRATGTVRQGAPQRLLAEGEGHAVDRLRQWLREAIEARVLAPTTAVPAALDEPGHREAGVIAALAVGDQGAIEREDWALYRHTGVAHLMSISGLHVTMFAWLAGWAIGRAWRRSARLVLWLPAPAAAAWGGLAAALAYAVLAGWGVPAQRTVFMLATATVVRALGLHWSWPLVWAAAAVAVCAIDPWALLQPGFWLSFVAVGLLLASGTERGLVQAASGAAPADAGAPWRRWPAALAGALRGGLRTQVLATLGLAPLTLVFFQQLSLVGFAANLVAIPLVTLVVTPLALLGVLLPPLWSVAAALIGLLNGLLAWLAAPAWAVWTVAAVPGWAVAAGLLGAALLLLRLPWRVRALGLPLLVPLLAPQVDRPAEGAFDTLVADVGQGTAVLVRTRRHGLLYDAGPQYSPEADAGERVLLPLLRALGERRLALLMLSHRDTDHVGGAAALLRGLPVERLVSSLEPGHALLALAAERGARIEPCTAGQRWRWDGVDFEVLHPPAAWLARAPGAPPPSRPNALSCVLRVQGASQSLLLTGDIERAQELQLVAAHGAALRSTVLLVPHHGSKTSSSAALLDAVAPQVAVVQAGDRNRYGHPAAEVVARHAARGIALVETAHCGAWLHGAGASGCWRALAPRYWRHGGEAAGAPPAD